MARGQAMNGSACWGGRGTDALAHVPVAGRYMASRINWIDWVASQCMPIVLCLTAVQGSAYIKRSAA